MMDVRAGGKSIMQLIAGAPVITDQVDAVCRTLELTPHKVDGLESYLGQTIELWYNNTRWFVGKLFKRSIGADGGLSYSVYDPLYFWKRFPEDWYFKDTTATQGFRTIAAKVGTKVYSLANTGAVLRALYYQGAEADKVAIDLLANTYKSNKRRFWYRYNPGVDTEGLELFERKVPSKIWMFQVGVNLTAASYEESIEEMATVVKLVNRDTGKVVRVVNADAFKKYGHMVHFEEVDKDKAKYMGQTAKDLLDQLSKVNITMNAEGINPNNTMPQFFSGDVIYVEERTTGILGGFYIRNVTQTFESDTLIRLAFDITRAPELPTVQYEDAAEKAKEKPKKQNGTTQQQTYDPETQKVMDQYGIK